jgi:putative ABC transport system substrate-binding protein
LLLFSTRPDPVPPVTQTTSRWPPRALGLQLHLLFERDLDLIATRLRELRAGALVFGTGGFIANHRQQLLALARDQALPTMGFNRAFAVDGGLMSYGSDGREAPHTVGLYAGRILKGEKPADLPVQQVTQVKLTLNLKTAKALGIEFPTGLLVRADEVIE